MARKRVSPTLLTDGISLVKGERFNSWRTVGSVVAAAQVFSMRDVDELVVLDVTATREFRTISPELVSSISECLSVPLIVGGGIHTLDQFESALRAGADKVVLGTVAVEDPNFITEAANRFGTQAVVVSVDIYDDSGTQLSTRSGTLLSDIDPIEFAQSSAQRGAGEILLQNVSRDGTMLGLNIEQIRAICEGLQVPVIASGGVANYEDIHSGIKAGAESISAGAIFQFTENTPGGARDHLSSRGVNVRVAR